MTVLIHSEKAAFASDQVGTLCSEGAFVYIYILRAFTGYMFFPASCCLSGFSLLPCDFYCISFFSSFFVVVLIFNWFCLVAPAFLPFPAILYLFSFSFHCFPAISPAFLAFPASFVPVLLFLAFPAFLLSCFYTLVTFCFPVLIAFAFYGLCCRRY